MYFFHCYLYWTLIYTDSFTYFYLFETTSKIIFNIPHRKVSTSFSPRWEKSATFIPYPHSSSKRHAHVRSPSARVQTVRYAGNESKIRE